MKSTTFRAKMFLGMTASAAVALAVGAVLISYTVRRRTSERIERGLVTEAKLAATLIGDIGRAGGQPPDEEADRLGATVAARVTLIAHDGRVLGDSAEDGPALSAMENHGTRPEVVAARADGMGVTRRYSTTVDTDMLYVAVRTTHPDIAVVRLALPLTEVNEQLRSIRNVALLSFVAALPGALLLSWVLSSLLGRRVEAIARMARTHADGSHGLAATTYGTDELGVIARALDESFRKLGQQLAEHARSRARLEAILAGMAEGVLLADARGRVQLANDAACRMLRLAGPPLGRPYVEVVRHPDIVGLVTAALRGESPAAVDLSLPSDNDVTVSARAAPVDAPDGRGAALVLHDISALRQTDRLRRDFVANVSHELRTPLTAIRGYVEALRDETADEKTRLRFLEIIEHHAQRMERLVRDLLKLARLEAGFETVELARTDVDALFRGVAGDLMPAAAARGQQIEVTVGEGTEFIVSDAQKLGDALRNLVENAVRHGADRSAIELESRRAGPLVELAVLDRGPGIPEPELSRIFERFYRVDKARSASSGGTGLGLSIARHLVERLGGEIRAANRPGGGTAFTIALPAAAVLGEAPNGPFTDC